MKALEINDEVKQADQLLTEWYYWAMSWRPNLGCPRIAPYCRQSKTSRQYDEEDGNEELHRFEMEAVERCISKLTVQFQQTIKIEMCNREVKAKLWRNCWGISYLEVLYVAIPMLRSQGLIRKGSTFLKII